MNKGTWKGGAYGFRLSGLSKLHQTKGNDGCTTVLDYLIRMLYARVSSESSDQSVSAALAIDGELLSLLQRCRLLSLSDLTAELNHLKNGCETALRLLQEVQDSSTPQVEVDLGEGSEENSAMLRGGLSVLAELHEVEELSSLKSRLSVVSSQV